MTIVIKSISHAPTLLNRPSSISDEAISCLSQIEIKETLAYCTPFRKLRKPSTSTIVERNKSTRSLQNRRIGIYQEIDLILSKQMLNQKRMSQNFKDASSSDIFKRKGNRHVCDNDSGIFLLHVAAKYVPELS